MYLPDPDSILEGDTKQTKFYALLPDDKIKRKSFENLLLASVVFDKREIILAK